MRLVEAALLAIGAVTVAAVLSRNAGGTITEGCMCSGNDAIYLKCPDGKYITVKRCDGCQYIYTDETCEEGCIPGQVIQQSCADGGLINSYGCVNNEWAPTDEVCPDALCTPDSVIEVRCANGSVIVRSRCTDGQWVSTGQSCIEDVSYYQ
ncbi:MAG: hypothetical protein PHI12_15105 [Dehalococcoidales bacterium]|jgi:hypothetical protein|nr:hypothetical protein [Dehalococcoidales bacterium]